MRKKSNNTFSQTYFLILQNLSAILHLDSATQINADPDPDPEPWENFSFNT